MEQDFRDFEPVIVDNQSMDNSGAVIERYATFVRISPHRMLFTQAYQLKKLRPRIAEPEHHLKTLLRDLGRWRWPGFLMERRLTRPFHNLRRFVRRQMSVLWVALDRFPPLDSVSDATTVPFKLCALTY